MPYTQLDIELIIQGDAVPLDNTDERDCLYYFTDHLLQRGYKILLTSEEWPHGTVVADIEPSPDPGLSSINYIEASRVIGFLRILVSGEEVFESLQFYVHDHGTFAQRAEGSVHPIDAVNRTGGEAVKGQIVERQVEGRNLNEQPMS